MNRRTALLMLACAACVGHGIGTAAVAQPQVAWEATRPVELLVAAGTGTVADRLARLIESAAKQGLMKPPLTVINKMGGGGAEGLLDTHLSPRNPHKLVIAHSNLFTASRLIPSLPVTWRGLTPVAMIAMDEYVLWVSASTPHASLNAYIDAVKSAAPGHFKMGGGGLEHQIINAMIEKAAGIKFSYVAFRSNAEAGANAARMTSSAIIKPLNAAANWRAGALRPLCVFSRHPLSNMEAVAEGKSWNAIPTCHSLGLNVVYQMQYGLFMPPNAGIEQVTYYQTLMKQVRDTSEWQANVKAGVFSQAFMVGADYAKWLEAEDARHRELVPEGGFDKKDDEPDKPSWQRGKQLVRQTIPVAREENPDRCPFANVVRPPIDDARGSAGYPTRPITLVVGRAGSASAEIADIVAPRLRRALGQMVETTTIPGGYRPALQAVACAAPDGHTLMLATESELTINPHRDSSVGYNAEKDFEPVIMVGAQPMVLVVGPSSQARSLADLIALAKANPGQLVFGSSGTVSRLAGEMLKIEANLDIKHVAHALPFHLMQDVIAGRVQMAFLPAASLRREVRPLAVTSLRRTSTLPDVPTIAELGFPGFDASAWYGLVAPARTPEEVVAKLHRATNEILSDPEVRKVLDKHVEAGSAAKTPEEFRAYIRSEIPKWAAPVRASRAAR